ncbi:MAG: SdpI family protein [Lachnospiraceae bacterium]|nr:SdpI family protein [Lachnospiraceae bacterium]
MWLLLTAILVMLPMLMLFLGKCFLRVRPNSKRCKIYYRTMRSMRNTTTTRFAHQVCGKFYSWAGRWSLLISLVVAVVFLKFPLAGYETACGLCLLMQTILLIVAVPLTEKALSHRFGREFGY